MFYLQVHIFVPSPSPYRMFINYNYSCKPSPAGEKQSKNGRKHQILLFPVKLFSNLMTVSLTCLITAVETVLIQQRHTYQSVIGKPDEYCCIVGYMIDAAAIFPLIACFHCRKEEQNRDAPLTVSPVRLLTWLIIRLN